MNKDTTIKTGFSQKTEAKIPEGTEGKTNGEETQVQVNVDTSDSGGSDESSADADTTDKEG
jgi:hypothetical protein